MLTLTVAEQMQCINAVRDELAEITFMIAVVANGNTKVYQALTGPRSTHYKLTKTLARMRRDLP